MVELESKIKLVTKNRQLSGCNPFGVCSPNVQCPPNINCPPNNCYPAMRPCMPDCSPCPPTSPGPRMGETMSLKSQST